MVGEPEQLRRGREFERSFRARARNTSGDHGDSLILHEDVIRIEGRRRRIDLFVDLRYRLRFGLLTVGTHPLVSEPDSRAALRDLEVTVSSNETPAETLDAIGLLCPEPLFQARTAIDALEPGEVLEVLADDRAAEEDLTRFAKRAGHEMVAVEDEGDYKRFLIRRGA